MPTPNYKGNKTKGLHRKQDSDEIGEVFDVNEQTVRKWIREGCPASKTKDGYRLNDGEVQDWIARTNRKITPGRPPKERPPMPAELGGDKDYWLARKYRVQCLKEEGEVFPASEVADALVTIASTFRNALSGSAPKMALQMEGRNTGERQELLETENGNLLDDLERSLRTLGRRCSQAKEANAERVGGSPLHPPGQR
jgi:phage terminase Nu1 subunit (DNA packaging protein)